MKQVIEKIKEAISECEAKGKLFKMPSLDRKNLNVEMEDLILQGFHYIVAYAV